MANHASIVSVPPLARGQLRSCALTCFLRFCHPFRPRLKLWLPQQKMPFVNSSEKISWKAEPYRSGPSWLNPIRTRLILLSFALMVLVTLSCTGVGRGVAFEGWAGPVISGETVYLASRKGTSNASVRAFDAFNGSAIARFTARGEPTAIYGTPVIEGGSLYTTSMHELGGDEYGRVWSVNIDDLSVMNWQFPDQGENVMGAVFGGPAFSSETNTVYVASADGKLYAIDALDGTPKRSGSGVMFDAKSPIWSTPVVSNGVVYFGTMAGTLYGIREEGGKVLEFKAGGALAATPLVRDGVVYIGSFDKKFYAIAGGRPRWIFPGGNWFWGEALLATGPRGRDIIFVGSLDGNLYALDADNGGLLWPPFKTGDGIRGGPVLASKTFTAGPFASLADQVLVVGSRDSMVYGLNPVTGDPVWPPFDAEARVLAPLEAQGNVVYFANVDHTLFAIDASTGGLMPNWFVAGQGQ